MKLIENPALPEPVAEALRTLWDAGYEAYPVGGCVRDALLGSTPHDWDICTAARPEETMAAFAGRKVIETGLKHGTVTVLLGGMPLEITTFRTESGYGDRRHPDKVEFVRSLEEDLKRRDFTMNAMALAPEGGVIDLFGGREDLAAGRVRCVGVPEERFREDALRILRALRFASRLDFDIEPETAAALFRERELLGAISPERIFSELKGLLLGPGAGRVLRKFGPVIFTVIPELAACEGFQQHNPHHIHDVWTHITMAVDAAPREEVLRLTMLLHDIAKPACYFMDERGVGHFYGHAEAGAEMAETILRRLRCDNAARQEIVRLITVHDAAPPQTKRGVRRMLISLGEERFRRLIACWRADTADRAADVREKNEALFAVTEALLEEILASEGCFSQKDLAVNGRDLIAQGMEPGPALGRVLAELFRCVTEEELPNERDILLAQAREIRKTVTKL